MTDELAKPSDYRAVLRLLQNYGLGLRPLLFIGAVIVGALILFYVFPGAHIDAIATILGLGIGIPGLFISVRLVLESKTAAESAREAARETSKEIASLEAYRISAGAIGDLERLKDVLLKRQWSDARSELARIVKSLHSIMNSGLEIGSTDSDALATVIRTFETVEGRLADAILKDQEPQNVSASVRAIIRQLGFLSSLSVRLRNITKKGQ